MNINNEDYESLRKISYQIALSMLHNHDDAEDTAHETLLKFINAKDIENAEAWTRKVTRNLVYESFRNNKRINNINKKVENECSYSNGDTIHSKLEELYKLDMEKIKKYLSVKERKIYRDFLSCSFSIKKYADKFNLTYDSARNNVRLLRHNLKAMYLREHGYTMTSTLLLSEWYLIYAMIRRKFLKKNETPFKIDKFILFAYVKNNNYDSVLVAGTFENIPVFFFVDGIMQKNRFKIINIRAPKSVKKITQEEKIKLLSDPKFNPIV